MTKKFKASKSNALKDFSCCNSLFSPRKGRRVVATVERSATRGEIPQFPKSPR